MLLFATTLPIVLPTWQYGGIGPDLDSGNTLLPLHPNELGRKIVLDPSPREAVKRSWTNGKCPSPSARARPVIPLSWDEAHSIARCLDP